MVSRKECTLLLLRGDVLVRPRLLHGRVLLEQRGVARAHVVNLLHELAVALVQRGVAPALQDGGVDLRKAERVGDDGRDAGGRGGGDGRARGGG